ncbi:MAG: NAD(P)/FAD-dependent oxidoreductase [Nitrososphaerota archaeon]|nr:NAD(P)/FAD-dependent oxidoreductase [Nitrososphaerota archaeon]
MEYDYDVIVAGGGMSGLLTAAAIGHYSKKGARVLVVDRNPEEEPGRKTNNGWTCGDAVSRGSVEYLAKNIGVRYGRPELEHDVKGVLVYSPDHKTKVLFEGEGHILNRKILPRRQVEDAKGVGAEFVHGVSADGLIAEDGWIRGIVGRNVKDGTAFRKTAKVVIDASGSATKLRRYMPMETKIEKEIDRNDLESTGRYIYTFEPGVEDKTWFDPDYAIIHLDQYLAPGGYCWTFPKGKTKVNIGLGVQKSALDARNAKYSKKDTLPDLIDQYVKENKAIKNPAEPRNERDEGNTKGNWQVPVRRHNDCLVANGYAVVGDAAWMPRPIDAGGIGPSIYSSVILGRVVAHALEAGDASEAGLWPYNVDYMRFYGYPMASFEVLRMYLQTLTNEQINYGMRYFLSEDDVLHITKRQHPEFNKLRALNPLMWFRVLSEPQLAKGLRYTAQKSEALISHNMEYPEKPEGWAEWKRGLTKLLQEAYDRFQIGGKAVQQVVVGN